MRLLCLSNGHGEDAIATRVLSELQQQPGCPEIKALPIVGEGYAYQKLGVSTIGTVQSMPSGARCERGTGAAHDRSNQSRP
jgi:uncharacterized protein (TIGR03492 family)